MSDDKLMRLQALYIELKELEEDPVVQEHRAKIEKLKDICKQHELTPGGAFSLLAPHINGPKSSIKIPDYRRLPHRIESKLVLHRDLRLLKLKAERLLDRLEEDVDVKKRVAFMEDVSELDLTADYAAQLLDPQRYTNGIARAESVRAGKGKRSQKATTARAKRYWRNPHTGEIVSGYSTSIMRIQRWKDEHGDKVVEGWEITEDEALDSANQPPRK